MKLIILGATGPSGQCLVRQSLEAGHDVTAVVRNPEKIHHITHEKLKVVQGDIFSSSSLQQHMTGHDAVLSCLGSKQGWMKDVSLYSESIKCIVAAMKATNITRFIAITAWGTTDEPVSFFTDWILKPLLLKKVLKDMGLMETYLDECDDINYTVVKPPGLRDGAATDNIKSEEGQFVKGGIPRMPRANVAKFMLSCLETNTWQRRLVAVAGT